MRKLDRYVMREFLGPFLAAITAFIVISLSVQLFWLAEMVVVKRTPLATVLRLVMFNMPAAIVQVLPFATLFGVLLSLGRLSRDSELSIMRAAGLRLSRISRPLIVLSILISLFGFYMGDRVAPKANLESRNIVNKMILGESIPSIDNNVFFRGPDNKFFYIGRISEDRATVQDVMIYDIGYGKYPQLITASKGRADTGTWVFEDGNIHECGQDGRVVSTAHFDVLEIKMERAVTDYTNSGRTTSEMSMKELKDSIDLFSKSGIRAKNLLIDYYLKLAQPLSSLIFAILAVPLAVRSPRRGGAVYSIGAGIAIITLYFIFESVVRSYGMLQATRIQPWLAAWSADIIFLAAALVLLLRADARKMGRRPRNGKGPAALSIVVLVAAVLLISASSSAAAGTAVKVSAQRLYYDGGDVWRAEGAVTISFDDVTITAGNAAINVVSGLAELGGMVTVTTKDSEVSSVSATCNIKTKLISFDTFEGKVSDERVKGYIYISGEKFAEDDGSYKLMGGYLTTCGLPQPHYRIEAESIEFTDDDFIIARNVSYFEANLRLFRLPYLSIPLREEDRMILPEFGWSGIDGVYVKTTMKRKLDDANRLTIRLDLFQISGLGAGIRHDYAIGGIGDGYYSLYGVKSFFDPSASWTAEVAQSVSLPLELRADMKYSVKGTVDKLGTYHDDQYTELKLSRNAKDDKTSASLSYKFSGTNRDSSTLNLSATHSSAPAEGLKLSGNVNYRRIVQDGELKQEYLNYKATLVHTGQDGKLTVNVQAADTMDDKQEVVLSSLKRLPEIQIDMFRMKLGNLPAGISAKFSVGRYVERILNTTPTEYLDAGKGEAAVDLSLDRMDLWGHGSFDLGGSLIGSIYSTGDARAYLSASTSLTVKPVNGWDIKLSYDYSKKFGLSPYRFDSLSDKNKVAASTSASFYGFRLTASTGYDFAKAAFDPFTAMAAYNYQDRYQADLTFRFALPDFSLSYVLGRVTLKPTDDINLKFGLEYSGSLGKLSKVETSGDVRFLKEWRVAWAAIYDIAREGLRKADIAVTKDLHCREITAGYQIVEQRFFVNLKFKAFPDVPIGIGTDEWTLFK
ncbi:MAG TPA: LptF/LptG family permease [Bacillota bacterium]|nr:LptF/LptG family permease [Bacillota bacterium]